MTEQTYMAFPNRAGQGHLIGRGRAWRGVYGRMRTDTLLILRASCGIISYMVGAVGRAKGSLFEALHEICRKLQMAQIARPSPK
jgi:hypothetical protein